MQIAKIALVTGATGGIGKATAKALAQQGMRVIIHGRSEAKAVATVQEIIAETGNKQVEHILADLFSQESVVTMAQELSTRLSRLDILINNAGGVFNINYEKTVDGIEKTIALNITSTFLLTELLLPLLSKSESARIIYTASAAHRAAFKPDMTTLDFAGYGPQKRYNYAKLYTIWLAQRQARMLSESGAKITVNISHPGSVAIDFGTHGSKGFWTDTIYAAATILSKIIPAAMNTPEEGAKTNIYLATSQDVEGITGKFFGNSTIQKESTRGHTPENDQTVYSYYYRLFNHHLLG